MGLQAGYEKERVLQFEKMLQEDCARFWLFAFFCHSHLLHRVSVGFRCSTRSVCRVIDSCCFSHPRCGAVRLGFCLLAWSLGVLHCSAAVLQCPTPECPCSAQPRIRTSLLGSAAECPNHLLRFVLMLKGQGHSVPSVAEGMLDVD